MILSLKHTTKTILQSNKPIFSTYLSPASSGLFYLQHYFINFMNYTVHIILEREIKKIQSAPNYTFLLHDEI